MNFTYFIQIYCYLTLPQTQIAAAGAMCCQKMGTPVKQFAPSGVIIISRALIGQTVQAIEHLVKSVGWQSVTENVQKFWPVFLILSRF